MITFIKVGTLLKRSEITEMYHTYYQICNLLLELGTEHAFVTIPNEKTPPTLQGGVARYRLKKGSYTRFEQTFTATDRT